MHVQPALEDTLDKYGATPCPKEFDLQSTFLNQTYSDQAVEVTPANLLIFEENSTIPETCPKTWDELLCWPETRGGTVQYLPCPKLYGFDTSKKAHKVCWSNGTWFIHPESNKIWSNYTDCIDAEDVEFRASINHLYVIGYSISLAAVIISLLIFFKFRSLRCTRIRIHIQLFISFALNNKIWIIWYKFVITDPLLQLQNSIWCQLIHILIQYFMLANYMWMFCEALHLHIALVVVFVRDEVTMLWFHLIGWGVPFIFVAIYSFYRKFILDNTLFCWSDQNYKASWILTAPVCISLVASLLFFANVLRVILTVMHPNNSSNPASIRMKRVARAALILIPLFGLQYILIPFRPAPKDPFEHLYEYLCVVIVSPQGLCVACLFCFANQDVQQAIKAYFSRRGDRNSRWSNYRFTGPIDSAGVYVVNGSSQTNLPMILLKRKSTTTVNL